ncbi:MAG: leucine-rich repeat domain-containing protein [Paludibacteraceae bacterium]|nr:leucine-rich repeat domain-containing protein [Paludibacteraceae bacterium]
MTLLFSLLLTVSAMLTVDNINYTIANNEATVTYSPDAKGEVTIPTTIRYQGVTCPVVAIADSAFYDQYQITAMNLPKSINSIGGFAFFNTSIKKPVFTKTIFAYLPFEFKGKYELPKSITEITAGAFCGCADLTEISLPKKLEKIGDYAFLATGITSPVMTKTHFAFLPTDFKGTYSIPNGITTISAGAFLGCEELKRINIPVSVTTIGECAFMRCSSLDSVIIPSAVTDIKTRTFDGCKRLIYVVLPPKLSVIGSYAFNECRWLSRIDFSNTVVQSIENHAFYCCIALQKLILNEGLTNIGECAFDQCNDLHEVTIPQSVNSVGVQAFSHTKISTPLFSKTVFILLPESTTGTYTVPEGITTIVGNAFAFCQRLEGIVLPSSVRTIGKGAFRFSSIRTINIPEGVMVDDSAFEGCKYLKGGS